MVSVWAFLFVSGVVFVSWGAGYLQGYYAKH